MEIYLPTLYGAIVSGSIDATGSLNIDEITSSLQGTSSYALTASYAQNVPTSSISSSYASTASYWSGSIVSSSYAGHSSTADTASFVQNARTASYWSGSITSASYAGHASTSDSASFWSGSILSASYAGHTSAADTASYIVNAQTASFVNLAQTASFWSGSILSASHAGNSDTANTASYVILAQTASFVQNAVSSSFATTASYASNIPQTASYALTSLSSSLAQTASFLLGSISSASYATHASSADSASYVSNAQSASYVVTAQTASYNLNSVSSSFATSTSYATNASNANTASYVVLAQTASYVAVTSSYVAYGVSGSISSSPILQVNTGSNTVAFIVASGIAGSTYNLNPTPADPSHIFEVVNDNASQFTARFSTYGTGSQVGQNDVHWNRYRGTSGAPTAIKNGDFFMSFGMRGQYDNTIGHVAQSVAAFQAFATEDWTATNNGAEFQFQTTTNGTAALSRHQSLAIKNNGALWITQNASLTPYRTTFNQVVDLVNSGGTLTNGILIQHTASSTGTIFIGDSTTSEGYIYHYGSTVAGNEIGNMPVSGALLFGSRGNAFVTGVRVGIFPGVGSLGGIDVSGNGVYIGTQAGMGTLTVKGYLELGAGTVSTPQLVLDASTLVTGSLINGAVEGTTTHIYYTAGGTRYQLDQQNTGSFLGTSSYALTASYVTDPISTVPTSLKLIIYNTYI